MQQITPTNGMVIQEDTRFEPGIYLLPDGLIIEGSGLTLDGNGAQIIGIHQKNTGISVLNQNNVTIKNMQISGYYHGIKAENCHNLTIKHCRITHTAEVAANTIFLDIWRDAHNPYGAAVMLAGVRSSEITNNDLQHQMNGLLTYYCQDLTVRGNNASYNSGFGFHLYETSGSTFENNYADYCCRYEPRSETRGHLGADSAGFLIVHNACHNAFIQNRARMGGDGFFLAGMSSQFEPAPCNDNLFENNDASYSPNIAFEATFSQGNRFINNQANHSNYGFWLGFSRENKLQGNMILNNRRAGIAVENGVEMDISQNTIQDNGYGLLIWSRPVEEFLQAFPENDTSKFWRIKRNNIHRNGTGIRIAANQDHGIRPYSMEKPTKAQTFYRPHDHEIDHNVISENRIGIQSINADRTIIKDNTFELNLAGDIKS